MEQPLHALHEARDEPGGPGSTGRLGAMCPGLRRPARVRADMGLGTRLRRRPADAAARESAFTLEGACAGKPARHGDRGTPLPPLPFAFNLRSEERRVGKESVSEW